MDRALRFTIAPLLEGDLAEVSAYGDTTPAQLTEELTRPWARIRVAREEGRGAAAFLLAWQVADELHVLNVATSPPKRRRGLARALVREAVDFARGLRLRLVLLEVRRSNHAAIALYRSFGFFAVNVRARYYPDDEDAVEMRLLMDPDTGDVALHDDEVAL